jgi:ferritin-like metal-binding protein YciE
MGTRLGSRFAEITNSLSHVNPFGRARQPAPTIAPSSAAGPSTREALNDRWREIRAGIGDGSAVDTLESFYRLEIEELRSAETQACALADEMWVTMLNGPLAERVSQYVLELRRRAAEHESLSERRARAHANQAMRALVQDASRLAEVCAPGVRDAALLAALQHIIHYLIASYGSIAAHAKALGRSEDATMFASHADSDQELDAELSTLAKGEVNPQAASASESPH